MEQLLHRMAILLIGCVALNQPLMFWPAAGQREDQQRDIEAKEVLKSRRQGKNPTPNKRYYYQPTPRRTTGRRGLVGGRRPDLKGTPKSVNTSARFPIEALPGNRAYMTVGITLWRVRLATETENKDS